MLEQTIVSKAGRNFCGGLFSEEEAKRRGKGWRSGVSGRGVLVRRRKSEKWKEEEEEVKGKDETQEGNMVEKVSRVRSKILGEESRGEQRKEGKQVKKGTAHGKVALGEMWQVAASITDNWSELGGCKRCIGRNPMQK